MDRTASASAARIADPSAWVSENKCEGQQPSLPGSQIEVEECVLIQALRTVGCRFIASRIRSQLALTLDVLGISI